MQWPLYLCQGQKKCFISYVFLCESDSSKTKFSWFCPCCKNGLSPYIFIYKDVNIFISALCGGSIGFFFRSCIKIYCWMVYIFLFFIVWVLNLYHSFVCFNHNYSDTWLSFQMTIACFYHLRGILPWQSKFRNISFCVLK